MAVGNSCDLGCGLAVACDTRRAGLEPAWADLTDHADWLRLGERVAAAPPADILADGRNRVVRLPLLGRLVVAKRLGHGPFWKRTLDRLRAPGRARRAHEVSVRLRELGFDCPEPVGWIEYLRQGVLVSSLFVSLAVAATVPGPRACLPASRHRARARLHALGREVGRLHGAGVRHPDLHLGNVLFADGSPRPLFIDLNRVRFQTQIGTAEGLRDLARLGLDGEAGKALLGGYCEERGLHLDQARRRHDRLLRYWRWTLAAKHHTRPLRRRLGL